VDKSGGKGFEKLGSLPSENRHPNGPGLATWPAFREPERAYVELAGDSASVKRGLRRAQCDLYVENADRAAASTRGR